MIKKIKNYDIVFLGLISQSYTIEEAKKMYSCTQKNVLILTSENKIIRKQKINGVDIISLNDFSKESYLSIFFRRILVRIEIFFSRVLNKKAYEKLSEFGNQNITTWIFHAFRLIKVIKLINPKILISHQALRYGFAASIYRSCKTYIRPFGQDIFLYGKSSVFLRFYMKYVLNNVNGLILFSKTAIDFIHSNYGLKKDIEIHLCDTVDKHSLINSNNICDKNLKIKYGLKTDDFVIFNIRRFQPGWGIEKITKSFINYYQKNPKAKFILIEGDMSFSNQIFKKKLFNKIDKSNLIFFERNVSLEEYSDLLKISDVGISLMDSGDMRSFSVMKAASLGLPLILNRNPEFLYLKKYGFNPIFLNEGNSNEIVDKIHKVKTNFKHKKNVSNALLNFTKNFMSRSNDLSDIYKKILR